VLIVALTSWLAWTRQEPISLNGGRGWDGVEYARVAEQLAAGKRPRAEAPFVYRVGAPALAAWLSPGDPLRGFRLVGGVAAALAPLLLFAWLGRFGLRSSTRLLAAALFATQWHAPLRLTPFYPAHADPLMWPLWLGGLLLLERSRRAMAGPSPRLSPGLLAAWCAGALAATPCREALLLPALALPFVTSPLLLAWAPRAAWASFARQRRHARLALPALAGLLAFALVRAWVEPTNSYGFLKTALVWAWTKSDPAFLHGLAQAVGPAVLALLLLGWREAGAFLARRQELMVLLVGVLAAGWLGGSDTERLLYWGAPVFLLLAGQALERLGETGALRGGSAAAFLAFLALAQALSQRMWWTIPDHPGTEDLAWPLLTPLSDAGRYLDLWSQHARPEVAVLSLAQYVVVVGAAWWWGGRLRRVTRTLPAT